MVIGTTGIDVAELKTASKSIPIFYAPNFSLGMALLKRAAAEIARSFPSEAHIDLIETHHAGKKDAPSGSALSLAAAVDREVKIHSLRSGGIIGEHSLQFNTAEERIEIFHQVHTRDAFAKGALEAALFLMGKPAGLYGMDELLAGKLEFASS